MAKAQAETSNFINKMLLLSSFNSCKEFHHIIISLPKLSYTAEAWREGNFISFQGLPIYKRMGDWTTYSVSTTSHKRIWGARGEDEVVKGTYS